MIIKGKDLTLSVNINGVYETFLHAQNCTLSVSGDLIESTTKDGGRAKRYEYTTYGYKLSLSGLSDLSDTANFLTLIQCIIQAKKLDFIFTGASMNDFTCAGTVLIPSVEIDSAYDALSSFKADLQGDGEFKTLVQGQVITGFTGIWDNNMYEGTIYQDI